jgi:hypothetical protein
MHVAVGRLDNFKYVIKNAVTHTILLKTYEINFVFMGEEHSVT